MSDDITPRDLFEHVNEKTAQFIKELGRATYRGNERIVYEGIEADVARADISAIVEYIAEATRNDLRASRQRLAMDIRESSLPNLLVWLSQNLKNEQQIEFLIAVQRMDLETLAEFSYDLPVIPKLLDDPNVPVAISQTFATHLAHCTPDQLRYLLLSANDIADSLYNLWNSEQNNSLNAVLATVAKIDFGATGIVEFNDIPDENLKTTTGRSKLVKTLVLVGAKDIATGVTVDILDGFGDHKKFVEEIRGLGIDEVLPAIASNATAEVRETEGPKAYETLQEAVLDNPEAFLENRDALIAQAKENPGEWSHAALQRKMNEYLGSGKPEIVSLLGAIAGARALVPIDRDYVRQPRNVAPVAVKRSQSRTLKDSAREFFSTLRPGR